MATSTGGLCECGCGEPTRLAPETNRRKGHFKSQPMRFLSSHSRMGRRDPGILIETRAEPLMLIPLSAGGKHGDGRMKYALIDAADYPLVKGHVWHANWSGTTKSFYAKTTIRQPHGERRTQALHRILLGLQLGDELHGDHRNNITLDNRRRNLRTASLVESASNRRRRCDNPSGFKGVGPDSSKPGFWRARIRHHGALVHLGYFETPEAAAAAYDRAARELHGEFAQVNGSRG